MGALRRRVLKGVVFDMDGTLTEAILDFSEIRRRIGIPPGADILTEVHGWDCEDRKAEAFRTIDEVEEDARQRMTLMPGCEELCQFLERQGVPRGLITRNTSRGVDALHARSPHIFSPALSREFRPYKPDPAALLHICSVWGAHPSEVVMVGDSPKDDIVSGNRAGSATILLDTEDIWSEGELQGELAPTFKVKSLPEVALVLEKHFEFRV
mmetsp:Transcript_44157/g.140539  ORF Transcript_44157/g.140539 Transcript_44157/m.140539 type:complete len:211 (-) Transcript_44157:309-941(-)